MGSSLVTGLAALSTPDLEISGVATTSHKQKDLWACASHLMIV
jgi:hypothetical protein